MIKFLLLVAIVGVVLWLLFGRGRGSRGAPRGDVEGMVRCAHCGIHLPRSEALLAGGETYCSPAHRDLGISNR